MKKFIIIGITLVATLSLLGSISLIKPKKSDASTTYLVGVEAKTNQDITTLSKLGYQFNAPAQPAAISPDVAIKNAKITYPAFTGGTNYSIEYQVLTLPKFNAFSQEALEKNPVLNTKRSIDHLPVYIISYENVYTPKFGPVDSISKEKEIGEYNVVVDASSGVPLLAFSYR